LISDVTASGWITVLWETLKNAAGMTFCCSRRPIACHGWR
jgi:hypothetical protein